MEDDQGVNLGVESSLTLRRLLVWTYDPKVRLKTLAALVDFCQGRVVSVAPADWYHQSIHLNSVCGSNVVCVCREEGR